MDPSPPTVLGPVSVCNEAVRVQGQRSGARVRIYIGNDPLPIGDAMVDRPDASVAIDQGRLSPGQRLRATQEVGGQEGPRTPADAAEVVEEAINGQIDFPEPVIECAQALPISGCCPGARLEVLQGGSPLGGATAVESSLTVRFDPGKRVASGSGVEVVQRVCTPSATPVSTVSSLPVDAPTVDGHTLPAPRFVKPLEKCDRLVLVEGIVPGAVVTVRRNGHTVFDAPVGTSSWRLWVSKLATGEHFEVEQALPLCERTGQVATTDVVDLPGLKPPHIDGPLCATPHQLTISRLKAGATVILMADGTEIGRWEAAGPSMPVTVKIPAGAELTVREEHCGLVSHSRPYPVASDRGRWFVVEDDSGDNLKAHSFAIHAALANTGKIVMFSGDQHNKAEQEASPQDINHCELFDCTTLTLQTIDAPTTDVFCSGHAFAPNGQLLVAGGTEKWLDTPADPHTHHFTGLRDAWTFHPQPDEHGRYWTREEPMLGGGRWYPTLLTLRSGEVLALSGHPEKSDPRHQNNTMETWKPRSWQHLGETSSIDPGDEGTPYFYPRIFSGPRGEVFSATPMLSLSLFGGDRASASWFPGTSVDWWYGISGPPKDPHGNPLPWREYGGYATAAVLLPLLEEEQFRFQVMRAGEEGAESAWVIDLGTPDAPVPSPTWKLLGKRSTTRRRLHSNLVLLPSAEVLHCGGVQDRGNDATAVHEPEMLIPQGNAVWAWDQGAYPSAEITRNYHSTALLMPDGRVFTGGGNKNAAPGGENVRELDLEIYEPWYVCRRRPRIFAAPDSIQPGSRLEVDVRGPGPITRLALVRCGSTTHGFNPDQRFIGLIANSVVTGRYFAMVPNQEVAIPGYYLLFACTEENVPSEAWFIRIDPR